MKPFFYKEPILRWFEQNEARMETISDRIWEFAEIKFEEAQSSSLLADTLETSGFSVERGIAGMPTAFLAQWSNGAGPIIALLGEYDALPGLGNALSPSYEPNGKNGHGCGHNLLGVGSMAAALSLKETMIQTGVCGTIRYYGCPAEEGGSAKVFMVRDGYFKDIDAIVRWHPINVTHVALSPCYSTQRGKCIFRNKDQYMSTGAQKGRNALDAIVLMDIAVSYLRANIPKNTVVRSMPTRVAQSVGVNPLETEVLLAVNSLEGAVAREYFEKMVQIAGGGRGRHGYGGRSHVHERYHKNAAQPCSLQSDVGQLIRNRTAGFYGRGQRACPPPGRRCKSGGQREDASHVRCHGQTVYLNLPA